MERVGGGGDAHLVAVVLGGKGLERGLNDAATETEHQVESGLLLDVVVGESAAILELLAGEDQALLVWGNALLILDLGLDIVWSLVNIRSSYHRCGIECAMQAQRRI